MHACFNATVKVNHNLCNVAATGLGLSIPWCCSIVAVLTPYHCVTRRKQRRPGIALNDNTTQVPTARSSADLTKPNHIPTQHTRAKDKVILQMATPQAASSQHTHVAFFV